MRVAILYNRDFDHLHDDPGRRAREDVVQVAHAISQALIGRGMAIELVPLGRRPFEALEALSADPPHAAINLCESIHGDARGECVLPLLLDMAGIPYTGSGSLSLTLALHKPKAKEVLRARGVPTPDWAVVSEPSQVDAVALPYPLIVKPSREDASAGIHRSSVVHDRGALRRAAREVIRAFDQPALVERYVPGREICVALFGDPPRPLPLSEIDFSALPSDMPAIVTYAGKWDEASLECQATPSVACELDERAAARVLTVARQAFEALECRDYGRVDIRLAAGGRPFVIDVNPNCDLSPGAGFARAAERAGIDYAALAVELVQVARKRHGHPLAPPRRSPAPRPDARADRAVHAAGSGLRP